MVQTAIATWTTAAIAGILPLHACPARCEARRRCGTAKLRSAPCLPLGSSKLLCATHAGSQPDAQQQHQLSISSPFEAPLPARANAGKSDPAGTRRRIDAGLGRHRQAPLQTSESPSRSSPARRRHGRPCLDARRKLRIRDPKWCRRVLLLGRGFQRPRGIHPRPAASSPVPCEPRQASLDSCRDRPIGRVPAPMRPFSGPAGASGRNSKRGGGQRTGSAIHGACPKAPLP
jgi:hypothetical protein